MDLKTNIENAINFADKCNVEDEYKDELICKLVELECIKSKNQDLRNEIKDLKLGNLNYQPVGDVPEEPEFISDCEFRVDYQNVGSSEIHRSFNLFDFIYHTYLNNDEIASRYVDKYAWDDRFNVDEMFADLYKNPDLIASMRLSLTMALYKEMVTRCILNFKRGNRETRFELDIYSTTPKIENRIYITILNDIL